MKIIISSNDELERIDSFLSSRLVQFSRSKIQKLIEEESITVNGLAVKKNTKLSKDDIIEVHKKKLISDKIDKINAWDTPLEVIHKEKDFAIVNKPLGVISHPTNNNIDKTLVNILQSKFAKELSNHPDPLRPGIVHRLDKDTTGVMIVPFNELSHWRIAEQFKERHVEKHYIALTWGNWNKENGSIKNNLSRNKKNPMKYCSSRNGKAAESNYSLIKSGRYFSSLNFYPKTGRTHQIRIHCSEEGFPIIGDELYGGGTKKINEYLPEVRSLMKRNIDTKGHYLHAKKITFFHPNSMKKISFEAKPDKRFIKLFKAIENDEI
tara:strand:+ start:998 stop:1963 length:966 start_codon:yes stop_codon:yes gene_type:complete